MNFEKIKNEKNNFKNSGKTKDQVHLLRRGHDRLGGGQRRRDHRERANRMQGF